MSLILLSVSLELILTVYWSIFISLIFSIFIFGSSVSEIMSLQRQFGRFIQALNVNEEGMEEIVGVLINYVAGQSQARQTILEQARSDQIDRREIGNLMRAVMNRELMYEELSYYLNQGEISLLQQAHKEQTDEEALYDRGRPLVVFVVRINSLILF